MVKEISPNFYIKSGYAARTKQLYSDDQHYSQSDIVHQPDAYALAAFLATRYGADTIIDIGCGSAHKLMELHGFQKIGLDFGLNLQHRKRSFPGEQWIEAELEHAHEIVISEDIVRRSVVICANVIEQLVDPTSLLKFLCQLADQACAIILTTPERDLVRGFDDMGPPSKPTHMREWNLTEFKNLLRESGLATSFIGLTVDNNHNLEKKMILAIVDRSDAVRVLTVPDHFRPLAVVATYNDRDIILQTISKLLDDRIDVHILDNWSSDGTFEKLSSLATSHPGLFVERFPADGPARYYEWAAILKKKDEIAQRYSGRWIIHHDSDEIRCSPWQGCSFRHGLYIVEQMGFNTVDFTVCDFRPVDDSFIEGQDPEIGFRYFEFGQRPGHFLQIKAWQQCDSSVKLEDSGGHEAQFEGRRIFPYKFILKHYSLRNSEQARKKIFTDRLGRFSPEERAAGWHIQYDHWHVDDRFLWSSDNLIEFNEQDTRRNFLVELISGIGLVR